MGPKPRGAVDDDDIDGGAIVVHALFDSNSGFILGLGPAELCCLPVPRLRKPQAYGWTVGPEVLVVDIDV